MESIVDILIFVIILYTYFIIMGILILKAEFKVELIEFEKRLSDRINETNEILRSNRNRIASIEASLDRLITVRTEGGYSRRKAA